MSIEDFSSFEETLINHVGLVFPIELARALTSQHVAIFLSAKLDYEQKKHLNMITFREKDGMWLIGFNSEVSKNSIEGKTLVFDYMERGQSFDIKVVSPDFIRANTKDYTYKIKNAFINVEPEIVKQYLQALHDNEVVEGEDWKPAFKISDERFKEFPKVRTGTYYAKVSLTPEQFKYVSRHILGNKSIGNINSKINLLGRHKFCFRCFDLNHEIKDCCESENDKICNFCKKSGHIQKDCKQRIESIICYACGNRGHMSNSCQVNEKERKCRKCNQIGHLANECNLLKFLDLNQKSKETSFEESEENEYMANTNEAEITQTISENNYFENDFNDTIPVTPGKENYKESEYTTSSNSADLIETTSQSNVKKRSNNVMDKSMERSENLVNIENNSLQKKKILIQKFQLF